MQRDCPICYSTSLTLSRHRRYAAGIPSIASASSYSQHGGYTCPLCNASVCDMRAAWLYLDEEIANTPMPTEYANSRVSMLCNDRHEQGETDFHALGLKCASCGSYNTPT